MKKSLKLPITCALLIIAGCCLNVEEEVTRVTLKKSVAELERVSMKNDLFETTDIVVTGTSSESLAVATTMRRLVLTGEKSSNETLSLSMSSGGEIGFHYTGDDWSSIILNDFSMTLYRLMALKLTVVTGDIVVTDIVGFQSITSTTGDISLEVGTGCNVSATTGDVVITAMSDTTFVDGIHLDVTTGDITIFVPVGTVARMSLSTTTGDISVPVNQTQSSFNGGGEEDPLIYCETTTGDITIVEF